MGQSMSAEEVAATKQEVYCYYPGLEQQLEMAFSCHDLQNDGELPFSTLEPVVRHLLMQYGLIEYLTRFSTTESVSPVTGKIEGGGLDCDVVKGTLRDFGVDIRGKLDMEDFKSFTVVWLKKILDTYKDDQAEWTEKLREQQEEQSQKYEESMRAFQDQYLQQQAVYQQGLEEQQRQINEWNKVLQTAELTQQQIYEQELHRMQAIHDRETKVAEDAAQEQNRLMTLYQDQLKQMATTPGGDGTSNCCAGREPKVINFTYPISATPYGACASAGAQEPTRRERKSTRSEKNKLFKNCC